VKGHFAESQEIAPRVEGGCDHDGEGLVLVRYGKLKLVWRLGRSVWSGIGFPRSYVPAELQLIGGGTGYGEIATKTIFEGGRLSKKRLVAALEEIREATEIHGLQAEHLDPKRTFVVEEL
jgi:hypothetical protein